MEEFLTTWFSMKAANEYIHIRAFCKETGDILNEFFLTTEEAAEFASGLPARLFNTYVGVSPRRDGQRNKAGVTSILGLWADVDYKHFVEDADAQRVLAGFDLEPTLVVESGGGLQAYWQFAAPLEATPQNVAHVEALMERLYHRLGDLDKVQDVSRIMRVPGTLNLKYATVDSPGKPVKLVQRNPEALYSTMEFEHVLPSLPQRAFAGEANVDRSYDVPTEEDVQAMLAVLPPTGWDYSEYLAILMAVHSLFPDERGWKLVQEWSPVLDASGNDVTEQKWTSFRSKGITAGTLFHHAIENGWVPPSRGPRIILTRDGASPTPKPRTTLMRREWEGMLDGYGAVRREELPFYLKLLHDYLYPVTGAFHDDWTEQLALTFLSSQFPHTKFENLSLNLWFLGIGLSSTGKSEGQRELQRIAKLLIEYRELDTSFFTSGTTRGMLNRLQGEGKQLLAVFDEFSGFMQAANGEYNSGIKEVLCSLYDGSGFAHQKAEETLESESPYVVLSGLTTPSSFKESTRRTDMLSGFMARMWFSAPDITDFAGRYDFDSEARGGLVNQLLTHIQEYGSVAKARFDTTFGESPQCLKEYMQTLGMNTGRILNLDEEVNKEADIPWGRVIARIKKVAALLELCEERPDVRNNVLYVHERNVALAIRLCHRGAAYHKRALGWLVTTKDEGHVDKVTYQLKDKKRMTVRELIQYCHLDRKYVLDALRVLTEAGDVTSEKKGRADYFVWQGEK